MKLYILNGGTIDADRAVIHPGDDSHRRMTLPVVQVLIQNEGHTVLFDTGMPPAAYGDSQGLEREYGIDAKWIKSLASPDQRVEAQLALLGLSPSDLDLVVNTHFHFDHAGGNSLVAGVPVAAQEAELIAARGRAEEGPVWWDAPGLQFQVVRGDWSPLAGVDMLHTPGHTPGHQSMLVRLEEQPWLFTWDAVYTEEHWRENKLGAVADVVAARASIERLRRIATEENARVIFGHDIVQWEALRKAPAFYV
ncbi:MAG: N-acyl homoserine lactonase family protein [Chloroflexi bacterium]|nr:N-acyl homoserine lactonase family protein [Chloroflexota bacterium]